jgi:hypothetical protein
MVASPAPSRVAEQWVALARHAHQSNALSRSCETADKKGNAQNRTGVRGQLCPCVARKNVIQAAQTEAEREKVGRNAHKKLGGANPVTRARCFLLFVMYHIDTELLVQKTQ